MMNRFFYPSRFSRSLKPGAWDIDVLAGVVAVGWGMKGIAGKLQDQVVEIALGAVCGCII